MAELTVVPAAHTCKFRIQSWRPIGFLAGAGATPNIAWPVEIGEVAEGEFRILCIGPTDWIVVATAQRADELRRLLQGMAALHDLSVVETSDALLTIQLQGSNCRELLAQGTGVDMHPRAFPAGRCARTRFANVPAILHCLSDGITFECHANRSYLEHVLTWFARAMDQPMPRIYEDHDE